MPTPIRSLVQPDAFGVHCLSDPGHEYADGSEVELLRVVAAASDRSSLSEELRSHIHDWATEYHLSPVRGNIVRGLSLDSSMTALEIGAGCAAVGRTLAEMCGPTDLVEPMYARAQVAAARVADLPQARVFQGLLEDVPPGPTYDVIVSIGVLEYVGGGTNDDTPYIEFLRQAADRLKPGGTVVVAIENPLGAKYIAGRPEDHTARPFDSLEGYLLPTPARTFTRSRLARLAEAAGLHATVLAALPDYKLTTAVATPSAFSLAPHIAAELNQGLSRDYTASGIEGADEKRLWSQLVEAGVAEAFPNSFLLLASPQPDASVWPQRTLAVEFATDRREVWAGMTRFEAHGNAVTVSDEPTHPDARSESGLRRTVSGGVRHQGPRLAEAMYSADDALPLLAEWATWLRQREPGTLGMQPQNIIVSGGDWHLAGEQWEVEGIGHSEAIRHGLLLLALDWGRAVRAHGALGEKTPRELFEEWAAHLEVPGDDDALSAAIALESTLHDAIYLESAGVHGTEIRKRMDTPLSAHRPLRIDQYVRSLEAELHDLKALHTDHRVSAAVSRAKLRINGAPLYIRVAGIARYSRLGERVMQARKRR